MTATAFKLAATRLTTWATATLPARGAVRRASNLPAAALPGVIGAAIITALRRSASVTRRDLARRLAVARATILGWETGTIPLYCVPYTELAQLAAALSHDGIPAEDILGELMLAAQCDHLIVGLLQNDEDFADVPPIDENTADGTASRELLRWAIRGPAPIRYQHVASGRPLLAPLESERITGIARDLATASERLHLTAYGQALLLLTVDHGGQGTFSQQAGKECTMATDDDESRAQQHAFMAQIAKAAGGTLHTYPRPGHAVRRVLLRDLRDDRGTELEFAQLEDDGTLRVVGRDTGPAVTDFFGEGITSYEWIYTIIPDKVADLMHLLGAHGNDDVLAALASYYEQTGGQLSILLKRPEIAADFATWHS